MKPALARLSACSGSFSLSFLDIIVELRFVSKQKIPAILSAIF